MDSKHIIQLREIAARFEAQGHKHLPHGLTAPFDIAEVIMLARFAREVLKLRDRDVWVAERLNDVAASLSELPKETE